MSKQKRHDAILKVITGGEVKTQEELTSILYKLGLNVTQATVSRDIKELNLIKIPAGDSGYKYSLPSYTLSADTTNLNKTQITIFIKAVQSIDFAMNLVVVKTLSGMAQAAASAIDAMSIKEIMGTIAGDDTIMCVAKSERDAKEVSDRFISICGH